MELILKIYTIAEYGKPSVFHSAMVLPNILNFWRSKHFETIDVLMWNLFWISNISIIKGNGLILPLSAFIGWQIAWKNAK